MNYVAPPDTADPPTRPPTRRALAKQQTRIKVLEAARRLFSEQGYEGATIRDIAAAAGMSTGAVFANFSDKSDLFGEILASDFEIMLGKMHVAAEGAKQVEDRLLRVFMTGYTFYSAHLRLARAAFSVSWSTEDGKPRKLPDCQALVKVFAEQVATGVASGELRPGADLDLRSEMLLDAYLANFRLLHFGGCDLTAMESRSRKQIAVLMAGARP